MQSKIIEPPTENQLASFKKVKKRIVNFDWNAVMRKRSIANFIVNWISAKCGISVGCLCVLEERRLVMNIELAFEW